MDPVSLSRPNGANVTGIAPPQIAALRASLPRWRMRIFWSFQVVFWLAIGAAVLGLSTALKPNDPIPWLPVALRVVTGFVVSSLVYLLFEIPQFRGLSRRVRWLLLVGVAPAALLASILLLNAGGVGGPTNWTGETTLGPLVPRMIAAGAWCLIIFGLELIEDLSRAKILLAENEATAIDLELRMLKAEAAARTFEVRQLQDQMNPHFLFNALNAVVASKHDPEAVETVTRNLADYLRFTLGEARTFEPLSRELQALEKYLGVQQARFGENLICRITCDRAAHSMLVPPMLIQPLLENALHYGAQTSQMPMKVIVTARVVEGSLEVVVANTGRWVVPDTMRSPSTGIRSLRKRLQLLIGDDATVDTLIDPDLDGGWVRVVIRMPSTIIQPSVAVQPIRATESV
ncbi:MAG: histidine kinase [Planctomycetes bacterium]|nr:histidine kinase [Planctomycetota bacterium]